MTVLDQATPGEAVRTVQQPVSEPTTQDAVVAVVMDFIGATLSQLDQLLEGMRLSPYGPGMAGSLFQWSRGTMDGVRVTEVWQSRSHFEHSFREEVEPRLSEIGLPEPEITTYDVHSYLTQGPTSGRQPEDARIGPTSSEAAGRSALSSQAEKREDDDGVGSLDHRSRLLRTDGARVVVDFAVGPSGVGPVMGFDSNDFFSPAPDADIDRNRTD